MLYANQKLAVVDEMASGMEPYLAVTAEKRLEVRNALHAHPELIDAFVHEIPAHLASDELAIVSQWKNAVIGSFFIFRYLKQHTVFLDDRSPPKAYGVVAVGGPDSRSCSATTSLDPDQSGSVAFQGQDHSYDGLLCVIPSSPLGRAESGKDSMRDYKSAKLINGIVTSLSSKK